MTSNNRQQITDNKIFFRVVLFMFFVLCSLLFVRQTQAITNYPIPELDSCRDAKECRLYCEIPANAPACWSYDKYVLHKNVLGDTTANLTFPIAELGNCASATECFVYCNQPQNQSSCLSYARKNGLVKQTSAVEPTPPPEILSAAKTELGCDSKDSCMAFCSNSANMDKCRSFAQKHGLEHEQEDKVSNDILLKAKMQLGCDSRDSCEKFCKSPDNQSKCFDFAKQNGLMKKEETDRMEKMVETRKKMLEAAKEQLFCDSFETCAKLCSNPDNRDKCQKVARQFEMVTSGNQQINNQGGNNQAGPGGCTSEKECREYCTKHPTDCPGFTANQSGGPNLQNIQSAGGSSGGSYLGPSGCRTQEECKEYCQKHPDQCPGFPKPSANSIQPQTMQNFSPPMPPVSMPPFNSNQNFKPTGGQFPPPSGFQQPGQQTGGSFNPPPPNPSQYPDR